MASNSGKHPFDKGPIPTKPAPASATEARTACQGSGDSSPGSGWPGAIVFGHRLHRAVAECDSCPANSRGADEPGRTRFGDRRVAIAPTGKTSSGPGDRRRNYLLFYSVIDGDSAVLVRKHRANRASSNNNHDTADCEQHVAHHNGSALDRGPGVRNHHRPTPDNDGYTCGGGPCAGKAQAVCPKSSRSRVDGICSWFPAWRRWPSRPMPVRQRCTRIIQRICNGWTQVRRPAQQGDVTVSVASATVERLKLTRGGKESSSPNDNLVVRVQVLLIGTSRKIGFEPWSNANFGEVRNKPSLSDNSNTAYPLGLFEAGTQIVDHERPKSLYPKLYADDFLVFAAPRGSVDFLRLELPASAVGGSGMLRFQIPKSMLDSGADEAKPATAHP